jgi:DUF4097 and DUF4098 domain-containing protein YvlB
MRLRIAAAVLASSFVLLSLAASPASPSPCDDRSDSSDMHLGGRDAAETHLDLAPIQGRAPRGTLAIHPGDNGAVSVRSWDQDGVLVCARVFASAGDEEGARALAERVRVRMDGNEIRTDGPDQTERKRWAVSMTVFVPRRTDLSVRTVNGPIRLEGVRGRIELRTTNGPIEVKGAGGEVTGGTTNGPVRVRLDGTRWEGEGLDLETVNGPVTISIPEDYSAELDASTDNGPISSPWSGGHDRRRHHVRTTLGSGGATIRIVTRNGPARIERM